MKVIQIELKSCSRKSDKSVGFRCDSLIELTSKDMGEIDSHLGDVGVLVLTDTTIGNDIDFNIDEIIKNLPENDLLDNHKTPSQRLRGVLWYNCQRELGRKPTNEEFADYYKREYEKLIEHYKAKLDDIN
jgi:hypothetical protein